MSLFVIFKNYTINDIARFVLRRFLGTQFGKIHYLRLNLDIEIIKSMMKNFNLQVKELSYEDFLSGDKTIFSGRKLELIKNRLADENYMAYGIIENGKLIYSTWFSIKYLGLPVQTRPIYLNFNEALLEDSYCDPIARGRGLHMQMNIFRLSKLHELGKTKILALVLDGNTAAFKVQYKCGFEDLGTFYCGKIFGVNFHTLKKSKYENR